MRRILIAFGTIFLLAVIAVTTAVQFPAVDVWLYGRLAKSVTREATPQLAKDNELSVLLVGTGSPLPDVKRAGPSTLIAAGSHLILVDVGLDCARNLLLWHIPLDRIDAILITHFHSDHIAELGELRLQTWVAGRKTPLRVFGPPGIEQVVSGFNEAYALDASYRTAHHGAAMLPPDAVSLIGVPVSVNPQGSGTVLAHDGLTISAIRVRHDPATPAYGYRFDYRGRSIVVSGDTAPTQTLVHAAEGADVLVHEALSPELVAVLRDAALEAGLVRPAKIFHDIPGYHTSPIDAARIANQAHVSLLVFTHLLPPVPNWVAEIAFLRGVGSLRSSGVVLGHDGLLIRLSGSTKRIEQSNLD